MLHLVTDQKPGEPDILSAVMHQTFEIRSLSGQLLTALPAPATGWTHEQLLAAVSELEELTLDGANGYLGGQWIGSTEV